MDTYPYLRLSDKEAFVMHTLVGQGDLHALGFTQLEHSPIPRGSVYFILRRMEEKGLVESRIDEAGRSPGRPRRIYSHTDLGVDSMAIWDAMQLAADAATPSQAVGIRNRASHLTNTIISDAIFSGASELRLSPRSDTGVVQARIDGKLRERWRLPVPWVALVTTRLKLLAKLDTGPRPRPQAGTSRARIRGKLYDLKTSVSPVADGERCVIHVVPVNDKHAAP